MGNKFSDQFKQAMQYAREESARLQHGYIATEHLLLALARNPDYIAVKILENLNVDIPDMVKAIEEATASQERNRSEPVPFTPRAKQTLEVALHEAGQMNAPIVDTDHLLLALASDDKGIAAQILSSLEIDYDRVKKEL